MNNQCSISQPFINEDDIMIANTSNEKENQIKALDDFQKKVEMEMKKEQSKQETSTQPEIQNQKTPIKKDDPKFDEIKNIQDTKKRVSQAEALFLKYGFSY